MNESKKLYNLKRELLRRKSQSDLLSFIMYNNIRYIPNWHHILTARRITDFIHSDRKKLMVFQPPQHGKSEQVSRNLPAWYLGLNRNNKVLTASYSIDLGRFFARDVQRIMISNEYNQVFPESSLLQELSGYAKTSDYFEVPGGSGFYKTVGVMGGISGFPGDLGIIDDPVKGALEAYSKTYRDRIWEWYLSEFTARLHNNSKQIIVMTRWHEDDLCGRILEQEGDEWEVLSIPAIKEQEDPTDPRKIGEALWPDRHSLEKLNSIRAMSEMVFNSLYQQRPSIPEGNIIKSQWFKRFEMSEIAGFPVNFVVDTAYSKDSTADYSVIMAYVKKNHCYYIINISRKKLDFPEFLIELKNQVALYGKKNSVVKVEPKATGKSVVQQIRSTTDINITEAKAPTVDKVSRLIAISPVIESGRVYLLNEAPWIPSFLDEISAIPNAKNDDQGDCLIIVCEDQESVYEVRF